MKKLVYIGGIGHCGSTILNLLLNESDGVFGAGQLADFYNRTNFNCSCGKNVSECEIWERVISLLVPSELSGLDKLGLLPVKERRFFKFLFKSNIVKSYVELHDTLLEKISEVSKAEIIIDSSKNLSRGIALLNHSKYDVYFIHLIRDIRGFVNSMNRTYLSEYKKKAQLTTRNKRIFRPAIEWYIKNTICSLLIKQIAGMHYMSLTYESLLGSPVTALKSVAQFLDCDLSGSIVFLKENKALEGYHLFSGNRIRKNRKVTFNPLLLASNKLKMMDNNRFWRTLGWPSYLWGYNMNQQY